MLGRESIEKIEAYRFELQQRVAELFYSSDRVAKIVDIAHILGAQDFVDIDNKKGVVSFRAKEYVDSLVERYKKTDIELQLPTAVEVESAVVFPAGEGEIQTGSGKGLEAKREFPRNALLIELLSEHNIPYENPRISKTPEEMVRNEGYTVYFLPTLEKTVCVNNEEGNTTIILFGTQSYEDARGIFTHYTKDQIRTECTSIAVCVDWDKVFTLKGNLWKDKVYKVLIQKEIQQIEEPKQVQKLASPDTKKGGTELTPPPEGWLTINSIAARIDKSQKWIQNRLADLVPNNPSYAPKTHSFVSGKGSVQSCLYYPPEVTLILDELKNKIVPAPAGWSTLVGISKKLGRDRKWVSTRVAEIEKAHPNLNKPTLCIGSGNQEAIHYPPEYITILDQEIKEITQAPEGWLTVKGIADITGKSEKWVTRKIQDIMTTQDKNDEPRFFLDRSNTATLHYPPHVVKKIEQESKDITKPPTGWKNASEISQEILRRTGKNEMWTAPRIKQLIAIDPGLSPKKHRDRRGSTIFFYPPEILERLSSDATKFEKAPTGWLTISGMATLTNKSHKWVESRCSEIVRLHPTWKPVIYLDTQNKQASFFPPEMVQEIQKRSLK